jgi:hypothetical protein
VLPVVQTSFPVTKPLKLSKTDDGCHKDSYRNGPFIANDDGKVEKQGLPLKTAHSLTSTTQSESCNLGQAGLLDPLSEDSNHVYQEFP